MSATRKPRQKKDLDLAELENLINLMRKTGMVEFEWKGFKGRLGPASIAFPVEQDLDESPEVAKARLQSALDNFKKTNQDADADLYWSA